MTELLYVILGNLTFAVIAKIKYALTVPAIIASFVIGLLTYFMGGFKSWVVLCVFYGLVLVSEYILNRFRKAAHIRECRDIFQIISIGGPFIISLALFRGGIQWTVFVGNAILSSSLCDTMASLVGRTFGHHTIDIITHKEVEPGVSGGVSLIGTVSGAIAALVFALFSVFIMADYGAFIPQHVILITILSVAGMLFDSLLGSSWQIKYYCSVCKTISDNKCSHSECFPIKGTKRINNTMVNLLSNSFVFIIACIIYGIF